MRGCVVRLWPRAAKWVRTLHLSCPPGGHLPDGEENSGGLRTRQSEFESPGGSGDVRKAGGRGARGHDSNDKVQLR